MSELTKQVAIAISSTLQDGTLMVVAENQSKNTIEMKRFWPVDEKCKTYLSLESLDGVDLTIDLLMKFRVAYRSRQPLAPGETARRIDLDPAGLIQT